MNDKLNIMAENSQLATHNSPLKKGDALSLPKGYKQTELCVIPEDWEINQLGTIGEIKMCKRIFSYQTKRRGSIPFYKIGTFGKEADAFISEELYNNYRLKYSHPKKGDILISASGTIGRTIIYDGKPSYFQDSNIVWIGNDEKLVSNDFLYYVLQVVKYESEGSTIQRLYNSVIKNAKFRLPPTLTEQTAIAIALSDMDSLIEGLEKLLVKKRNIKQGAMQELLTPKEGWNFKPLCEVSYMKGRIGWQGLKQSEFTMISDQPFLITGMNFKDGSIRWNEVYHVPEERYEIAKDIQLRKGDVLMTKDGTIGKLLYVSIIPYPYKATLNSHLLLFRPLYGSYNPKFLYYQLSSKSFKNFIEIRKSGTTFFGISQESVGEYHMFLPKLEEQNFIANTLTAMDNEITQLETQLSKYKNIKTGMMQELLTGKKRLV
jgi:type I restriction enzyme S subunit